MQNEKAALTEVARVLKPRGRIALSMWGAKYHELTLLSDALEAIGRPRIPPPSPARAVRALERAGFRAVERRDLDLANTFADVDAYIAYRRGFVKPLGVSTAFYERYISAIRRRAEQDADPDGRFTLGWTLSAITGRR